MRRSHVERECGFSARALERGDVIVDELVSALTMFRAVQTRTSALLIADCSSSGGLG